MRETNIGCLCYTFISSEVSTNLDNESLDAFFAEIKAIVNSRPLVVEAINNGNSEVTLSLTNLDNEIKGNSAATKGI